MISSSVYNDTDINCFNCKHFQFGGVKTVSHAVKWNSIIYIIIWCLSTETFTAWYKLSHINLASSKKKAKNSLSITIFLKDSSVSW